MKIAPVVPPSSKSSLTAAQRAARDYVTKHAEQRRARATCVLQEILSMSNLSQNDLEDAVRCIRSFARVALHFHPDRPVRGEQTVVEAMDHDGVYRSQFETGLSGGNVSAWVGGARDRWEQRLFGGAYQRAGSCPGERPKYGALDLMLHPDGPSPRFGSCYLLLRPEVSRRCTFTYLDSHEEPPERGTYEAFNDVLAALLSDSFRRETALGEPNFRPPALVAHLRTNLAGARPDPRHRSARRNLDHYVEAQVHGDVSLARDAELLVVDPCFQDSETGAVLERMCDRYGLRMQSHMGFALRVDDVVADFRGPLMPALARRVATAPVLTACDLGAAARDHARRPAGWSDWGPATDVLQGLKYLWYVLVRFGRPH